MPQSSTDPVFPPPGLTCTPPYLASIAPLVTDCKKALERVPPVKPGVCTKIWQTEKDIVTVGTCIVHTYSAAGRAHCLDGNEIRNGIQQILRSCTGNGYTSGSYTWTAEGAKREGVMLLKSASVEPGPE